MRKLQKPPVEELRRRKEEPLAEGLQITVPTDSKGRRLWRKMTDEQIVEYTRKWIEENRITGRKDLSKTDLGLYGALQKRGLLGEIRLKDKRGKRRFWASMSNEDIMEIARKVMEERGISERNELRNADSGLYYVLGKRGLVEDVGFENIQRSWENMSDEEVIELAKTVMENEGITGRKEMVKVDSGLYYILGKRGLLDKVGFEEKRRKKRSWNGVSDEEVIELAKTVMERNGISGREELKKTDLGLYDVLRKRRLLDSVGFEKKLRSWESMSDMELVTFAKRMIRKNNICGRKELKKTDSGLYGALRKRSLLDRVFARIEQQRDDLARDAVIDALEAFAANDNNSAEDDVA
ncbi:MAG: hypothetical protein ABH983_00280 [Candidatus Micrarchaeota archaeon]